MELIDEAKAKLGSYRAVAKHLGVTEGFISNVRHGYRPLPPYHIAKLAELVEKNPAQAFIEAHIQAAEGKDEAATLRRWFSKVAAIIAAVFVVAGASGLSSLTSTAYAASGNVERPGSVLPPNYSMRPTFRRAVGVVGRFWRWLRGQSRSKSVRRRHATRTTAVPCGLHI